MKNNSVNDFVGNTATASLTVTAAVPTATPTPTEGAYHLSYYDTSTAFDKSEGGYGGAGHSGGSGDALVRIVNAGNFEVDGRRLIGAPPSGDVCANIYVFNDVPEMRNAANVIYRPTR